MLSNNYENWLQAWELIRDNMPDSIMTFDALDEIFDLDIHDCSVNDMLYELDEELSASGLDDLHLLATRAEIARWVYSNFTEETGLNLETVATMLSRQRPKTGSWAAKTAVKQREGNRVHPISLLFRELPLIQHVLENISDSLPQCQFYPFFYAQQTSPLNEALPFPLFVCIPLCSSLPFPMLA
jgi:hypothetical protein